MYNISDDVILSNKQEFIEILSNALSTRENCDTERLLSKLEHSDFFTAPASTRFHASYRGGLVDHSLNVYHNMMSIAKSKHLLATYRTISVKDDEGNETGETKEELVEGCLDSNSIAIVALLHDVSKMNYYELGYRNKKVYCESGSKYDAAGRFDWVTVSQYQIRPVEERFLYGNHEETSEFIIRQFIPLTYQESTAILHHHFTLGYDSIKNADIVSDIYNRYTLAALLHIADMVSCCIDERF